MQSVSDLRSQRFSMVGVRLDALEQRDLISIIEQASSSKDRLLILNHNLHSLYLYETNPGFAAAYERASLVYIDGMPVVWLGRLAGLPVTAAHRITFLDSFDSILNEAVCHGWRVFYLGSSESVLNEGLSKLRALHPGLLIEGRNGFFNKQGEESDEVIDQINAFRPDVLFVGMGMPIQEKWIEDNLESIRASAILTSGATLDYVTGHAYRPPAWAGPLGLYGVFRLFHDPKRLWGRYLVEPIFLLWRLSIPILRQRMSKQKHEGSAAL